jgi:hypothetical protein
VTTSRAPRFLATAGLACSVLLVATSCGKEASGSPLSTAAPSSTVLVASEAVVPEATTTTEAVVPEATATTVVEPEPDTSVAPSATEAVTDPPAPAAGGKVKINEASSAELTEAFKAAGVTNAARWAREVEEYRPYPSDPGYGKLRQELGKYNIAPDILELIISTLEY